MIIVAGAMACKLCMYIIQLTLHKIAIWGVEIGSGGGTLGKSVGQWTGMPRTQDGMFG